MHQQFYKDDALISNKNSNGFCIPIRKSRRRIDNHSQLPNKICLPLFFLFSFGSISPWDLLLYYTLSSRVKTRFLANPTTPILLNEPCDSRNQNFWTFARFSRESTSTQHLSLQVFGIFLSSPPLFGATCAF